MPTQFSGAIQRDPWVKLGENPSVLDFAADDTGATSCVTALQAAIDTLASSGKANTLRVPGGTYSLDAQIVLHGGVTIEGDGDSTVFVQTASISDATKALFSITESNCNIRNCKIQGQTTTAVGINNPSDPMASNLTKDTLVWIRGGANHLKFQNVTFTFPGGYSILIDARSANISDVVIEKCNFTDCHASVHGTTGDYSYGGWNGSIHYQGDGSSFGVSDLRVEGCRFYRMSGHCVWGHAYANGGWHRNITVSNCQFDTVGLDCILFAVTKNAVAVGNTGYQIGYVTKTTSDTPTPAWNETAARFAVFIDCSAVEGFTFIANSATRVNGEFIDLDGACNGNVIANSLSVDPQSGFGPVVSGSHTNRTKGIQTANNYYTPGGTNINIIGNTLVGTASNAIVLYNARGCRVMGNKIDHSSTAAGTVPGGVPVWLINGGSSSTSRSYDNEIIGNTITYDQANFCIREDQTHDGVTNVWAGEKNYVASNTILGANSGEFKRDASSGSSTALRTSTNSASATSLLQTWTLRDGFGTTGAHKLIRVTSSASDTLFTLADYGDGAALDPNLNLSLNGTAGTGSYSTGNRSTIGQRDSMNTGTLLGDSLLVLGRQTYSDARANVYDGNYILLRRKSDGTALEVSYSVTTGVRNWTTLAATPSGATTQVQFNDAGAFAGKSTFVFTKATDTLTVPNIDRFKVPRWGDTHAGGYITLEGATGFIDWKLGPYDNYLRVSHGSASNQTVLITGESTGVALLQVQGNTGLATIAAANGYMQSPEGFLCTGSNLVAFNAANCSAAIRQVNFTALTADPTASDGTLYFNSSLGALRVKVAGSWTSLGSGGGGSASGTNGKVQLSNGSGSFTNGNLIYDTGNDWLRVGISTTSSYSLGTPIASFAHPGNKGFGCILKLETVGNTDPARAEFTRYNGGSPKSWSVGHTQTGTGFGVFEDGGAGGWGTVRLAFGSELQTGYSDHRLGHQLGSDAQTSLTFAPVNTVRASLVRAVGANGTFQLINYGTGSFDFIQNNSGIFRWYANGSEAGNIDTSRNWTLRAALSVESSAYNAIQAPNGAISSLNGYYVQTTQVVNSTGQFIGTGVNVNENGVTCRAVNPKRSGVNYTGQDAVISVSHTIGGSPFTTMTFVGGVYCGSA